MLTVEQVTEFVNAVPIAEISHWLVDTLPDGVVLPVDGTDYINPEYVPVLAEAFQGIVAYTIASIIDAGSERDVVMEDDTLASALEGQLLNWVPSPQE